MPLFDSLYNFARGLVHNQNDAEDLVQETYLKALPSFASFRRGTNFRAWMFRILKNTFLSSCSKLERRMTVAIDSEKDGYEPPVDTETPETILMNRSNSQLVQRAIDNLPVHYRETLLLCEVEEMSYPEIAGIIVDPGRNCHVTLGQSPEDSSRVAGSGSGPVDRHSRTERKEPGATRAVSVAPDFITDRRAACLSILGFGDRIDRSRTPPPVMSGPHRDLQVSNFADKLKSVA